MEHSRCPRTCTDRKSFCKISVADITDYCHIARQTFYNHFLDKYDVIDWVYAQLIKQTTCRIGIDMTWEEATSAKLSVMKSKQKLFSALYNIDTNEGLKRNEPRKVYDYYVANIARLTGKKLDVLESSLLKYIATAQLTLQWNGLCRVHRNRLKYSLKQTNKHCRFLLKEFFLLLYDAAPPPYTSMEFNLAN